MKTQSFFTLEWGKHTQTPLNKPRTPEHTLKNQIEMLSLLETQNDESASVIDLSKFVWTLHSAFEERMMTLTSEKHELELMSSEVFNNIGYILSPLWNWNEELMRLYATAKTLKTDLFEKREKTVWQDALYQFRVQLEYIKTKNLLFSRNIPDSDRQVHRGIAVCVSMYGHVTGILNEIDTLLGVERHSVPKTRVGKLLSQIFYNMESQSPGANNLLKVAQLVGDRPQQEELSLSLKSKDFYNYRALCMPTEWLNNPPQKAASHFISSVLPQQYQNSFISLQWDESTPIQQLNVPLPENTLEAQLKAIREIHSGSFGDIISISKMAWAVHAAAEARTTILETELRKFELYSNQMTLHLLVPTWNFDREIIELYSIIYRISLQKLSSRKQVFDLKGVRDALRFIKANNLKCIQKGGSVDIIPRSVAQCIMLCDECVMLLDIVNNNFASSSRRIGGSVFQEFNSMEWLVDYLQDIRGAGELSQTTEMADIILGGNQIYKLEEKSIKTLSNLKNLVVSAERGTAFFDVSLQNIYDASNEHIGFIGCNTSEFTLSRRSNVR